MKINNIKKKNQIKIYKKKNNESKNKIKPIFFNNLTN